MDSSFANEIGEAFEMIGGGNVFGIMKSMFRDMELAEQEVSRAKEMNPMFTDVIQDGFQYLHQGSLSHLSPNVYRWHCREILQRLVDNEDPRQMTKAEGMLIIQEGSLLAPLQQDWGYLYTEWFKEFSKDMEIEFDDEQFEESLDWVRQSHPRASEEIHNGLIRKFQKHPMNTRKEILWKKRKI